MAIQSLNNRVSSPILPSKSVENGQTKPTDSSTAVKNTDSIEITHTAKKITKAFDSSSAINRERVDAIKNALNNGSYQIDAEKIAHKMIQMESI